MGLLPVAVEVSEHLSLLSQVMPSEIIPLLREQLSRLVAENKAAGVSAVLSLLLAKVIHFLLHSGFLLTYLLFFFLKFFLKYFRSVFFVTLWPIPPWSPDRGGSLTSLPTPR